MNHRNVVLKGLRAKFSAPHATVTLLAASLSIVGCSSGVNSVEPSSTQPAIAAALGANSFSDNKITVNTTGNQEIFLNWPPIDDAVAYLIYKNGDQIGQTSADNFIEESNDIGVVDYSIVAVFESNETVVIDNSVDASVLDLDTGTYAAYHQEYVSGNNIETSQLNPGNTVVIEKLPQPATQSVTGENAGSTSATIPTIELSANTDAPGKSGSSSYPASNPFRVTAPPEADVAEIETDTNEKSVIKVAGNEVQAVEESVLKAAESDVQAVEEPALKAAESGVQAVEEPALKAAESDVQAVEESVLKAAESEAQPVEGSVLEADKIEVAAIGNPTIEPEPLMVANTNESLDNVAEETVSVGGDTTTATQQILSDAVVELKWQVSTAQDFSYHIYYSESDDGVYEFVKSVDASTINNSTMTSEINAGLELALNIDNDACFKVSAIGIFGESARSDAHCLSLHK